jgi:hypothetical protein
VFLFCSLATQHFKAAAKAYHMHDHLSAQQHSRAGHENIRVAQELNLKWLKKFLNSIIAKTKYGG